jgi:hypothetical protein
MVKKRRTDGFAHVCFSVRVKSHRRFTMFRASAKTKKIKPLEWFAGKTHPFAE